MAADCGPDLESSKLRVLTLNCWGIPFISKQVKERFHYIAKELATGKYDIVSLQEVWSKEDYQVLCDRVKTALPYSLYFYSGVIGSGVCVFSRYPITESFTYRFTLNGYFYKILHGDWFGGKSAGYCIIDHPRKPIHLFTTHLHAEYNRKDDMYLSHRVTQAYQLAQFINHVTKPSDCVLVCGDMNSEPTDLCYRIIRQLPGLDDSWLQHKPEGYHGNTCDTSHNSYTGFTLPQHLRQGHSDGKRIDYVFYRAQADTMVCVDCQVTMQGIPGEKFSYSDHEGILATFAFRQQDDTVEQQESKNGVINTQAVLKEISSFMKGKLDSTPYHKRSIFIIIALAMFILLPLFLPEGSFLSFSMGTYMGMILYVFRVFCSMLVPVLLFYVLLSDRDEYHAYQDIYEAVNLTLQHIKSR